MSADPLATFDAVGLTVIGAVLFGTLISGVIALAPNRYPRDDPFPAASPPPRSRPRHRSRSALTRAGDAIDRITEGNAGLLPRNAVDPEVTPPALVLDPPAAVTSEAPEPLFGDWATGEFAALVLDDRGQQ